MTLEGPLSSLAPVVTQPSSGRQRCAREANGSPDLLRQSEEHLSIRRFRTDFEKLKFKIYGLPDYPIRQEWAELRALAQQPCCLRGFLLQILTAVAKCSDTAPCLVATRLANHLHRISHHIQVPSNVSGVKVFGAAASFSLCSSFRGMDAPESKTCPTHHQYTELNISTNQILKKPIKQYKQYSASPLAEYLHAMPRS